MSNYEFKRRSCLITLSFLLVIAVGCSTTGSLTMHDYFDGQKIKGTTAVLKINHPDHDGTNIARQLRGEVAAQLLGSGLFRSITDEDDQDASHKILIKLTDIREVSGVSRVMWGALSGNNKVAGDVVVINLMTGQTERSFSFIGESAAHPMSGKSDMKDAISKSAEKIIKGLS